MQGQLLQLIHVTTSLWWLVMEASTSDLCDEKCSTISSCCVSMYNPNTSYYRLEVLPAFVLPYMVLLILLSLFVWNPCQARDVKTIRYDKKCVPVCSSADCCIKPGQSERLLLSAWSLSCYRLKPAHKCFELKNKTTTTTQKCIFSCRSLSCQLGINAGIWTLESEEIHKTKKDEGWVITFYSV